MTASVVARSYHKPPPGGFFVPEDSMSEQTTAAATTTDTAAAEATTDTAATEAATQAETAVATTEAATTETKTEGEAPVPKAPEKYELTTPEGFQLEPETTAEFETLARELDLSNEDANKLLPLGAKLAQKIVDQQQVAHVEQVGKWLEASKTDKEFGGEKFDASVAVALQARDRFATPELKTLMDQTGLGNHPEIVRLFHRIGTAIADDSFVQAPSAGGSAKSTASILFDHPTSRGNTK